VGRTRVKVVDRDRGFKRIRRELRSRRIEITVGVQGPLGAAVHGGSGDATVADIAAFNELGLGVPERSFLRSTLDANAKKYRKLLAGVGQAAIDGRVTLEQGAGIVGEVAVGDAKQAIADGIPPPNAPSTIERKGSSRTLIDTGQMRSAITKQVKITKAGGS